MRRWVAVTTGFLTMLVGAFLDRRGLGSWDLDRRLDLGTVGVVVLVVLAGLLALGRRRRTRVAGAVLAVPGLVGTVLVVVLAIGTGLPGPSTAVLAVGSALVGLAAVAGVRTVPTTRPAAPALVLGTVGLALLVAGLSGVAVALVVDAPVLAWSTVAEPGPGVRPAPLPGTPPRPTRVAWTWSTPDGVRDVRAAGTGVVVADDTGITALDGPSGVPRWAFHRAGASLASLQVSPDRRSVVVAHGSTGYGDDEAGLATVLDAGTGARLAELPLRDADRALLLTDRVVVVPAVLRSDDREDGEDGDELRTEYTASDLRSGDEQWQWRSREGCVQFALYPTSTRTTVPVSSLCGDRAVMVGLDEGSGRERWVLDAGPGDSTTSVAVRSTSDGTAVVALGTRPRPLVDTTTGEVRTRITGGFPVLDEGEPLLEVEDGPDRRDLRLDPATGAGVPLPPAPCPLPHTVVVGTAAGGDSRAIAVCAREDPAVVTVDGGPPIVLGEVRTDGSGLGPTGRRGVRLVPAPGAVVVAGTARGATVVRGLA